MSPTILSMKAERSLRLVYDFFSYPREEQALHRLTSKRRWRHWRRLWNAWRHPTRVGIWFHSLSLPTSVIATSSSIGGAKFCKRCGKDHVGKESGIFWTHGMLWVCAQRPASGMFRGSVGRMASFFSSSRRSASLFQRQCVLSPFVLAERLRACALTGLHLMAAEGASRSGGSQYRIWETHGGMAVQEALDVTAISTLETKERVHRPVRCTSTTMSAGLLMSSGKTLLDG